MSLVVNKEICGDCGALEAVWISVNKGVFLCADCCSIHRILGRHISQVKHIVKSTWHPNQLSMVYALHNNGVNRKWEYNLMQENDSSSSTKEALNKSITTIIKKYRKPIPTDSIRDKSEFIKAKYVDCIFAYRSHEWITYETNAFNVEDKLSERLYASVKTTNLEATFWLLINGANPNYTSNINGATPLHAAVDAEQTLQIELLVVYGADVTQPDLNGRSPLDYAKKNADILLRMIQMQYEVTDTFSYFLVQQMADHKNGVHFLVPKTGPLSVEVAGIDDKFKKMPSYVFEQLAGDCLDEIDRRRIAEIWCECGSPSTHNQFLPPFLPVNSSLSTTRNQGRQKLARFTKQEFQTFIHRVLIEAQRRQNKSSMPQHIVYEDPLYDSVASDEEYAMLTTTSSHHHQDNTELMKQLQDSDGIIMNLRTEICKLWAHVEALRRENSTLKNRLATNETNSCIPVANNNENIRDKFSVNMRPSSMYETREGFTQKATTNWHELKSQIRQQQTASKELDLKSSVLHSARIITQAIKDFCAALQGFRGSSEQRDYLKMGGDQVMFSVVKMASILTNETDESETIRLMLETLMKLLASSGVLLAATQTVCGGDEKAGACAERHFSALRNYAFHLAKCTKRLITKYSDVVSTSNV